MQNIFSIFALKVAFSNLSGIVWTRPETHLRGGGGQVQVGGVMGGGEEWTFTKPWKPSMF